MTGAQVYSVVRWLFGSGLVGLLVVLFIQFLFVIPDLGCYKTVKWRNHTMEKGVSRWSMVWFRWVCTASCDWHMRCTVGRGDAWPLLLSPCNTMEKRFSMCSHKI